MPDSKLIIRKQTLPTRCEICHQSDMFDPETADCQRCANLPASLLVEAMVPSGREFTSIRLPVGWVGWIDRAAQALLRISLISSTVFGVSVFLSVELFMSSGQAGFLALIVAGVAFFGIILGVGGLLILGCAQMVYEVVKTVCGVVGNSSETS